MLRTKQAVPALICPNVFYLLLKLAKSCRFTVNQPCPVTNGTLICSHLHAHKRFKVLHLPASRNILIFSLSLIISYGEIFKILLLKFPIQVILLLLPPSPYLLRIKFLFLLLVPDRNNGEAVFQSL